MSKAKKPKKHGQHKSGIMKRSDIPYAQRIAMQQRNDIAMCREHSAQIAMFCQSVALHEIAGIGYKRLVIFSLRFKEILEEFYEEPEVGMVHAAQRMAQMGRPISGEFFSSNEPGETKREKEVRDNSLQAVQVALICSAIAMNDEFGFGKERQERICKRVNELSARYAREGQQFLLEEMEKIGFPVVNGKVLAFVDEDGKAVTPSRAKKEGYPYE